MIASRPRLSVVIASSNARSTIAECLGVTTNQCRRDQAEIIVVDNSIDGTDRIIKDAFPDTRVVSAPPPALVPELWELGILHSHGDIVAITTGHCIPARDWVQQILDAHQREEAAVGGAVEIDESVGLVDWAIYFCRYSPYMLPFRRATVPEIAGDNASYRRAHLDACRPTWRGGFWEPVVHVELRKRGLRLVLEPTIVVYHKTSLGLRGFLWQRFRHGAAFGKERAARLSAPRLALYVGMSPAIPAIFLVRIARRVFGKRRHRAKLVLSLPVLVLFLLAWAAGELSGYLGLSKG